MEWRNALLQDFNHQSRAECVHVTTWTKDKPHLFRFTAGGSQQERVDDIFPSQEEAVPVLVQEDGGKRELAMVAAEDGRSVCGQKVCREGREELQLWHPEQTRDSQVERNVRKIMMWGEGKWLNEFHYPFKQPMKTIPLQRLPSLFCAFFFSEFWLNIQAVLSLSQCFCMSRRAGHSYCPLASLWLVSSVYLGHLKI